MFQPFITSTKLGNQNGQQKYAAKIGKLSNQAQQPDLATKQFSKAGQISWATKVGNQIDHRMLTWNCDDLQGPI